MNKPITRSLWGHQQESWTKARALFAKGFRSILIQGVTGTGKTRMVAAMIRTAINRHRPGQDNIHIDKRHFQTVWFVVPRKELLWQSNKELNEWKIQNQVVSGGKQQIPAFNTYVWSRDTLIRRLRDNKIRIWPDVIIFDEAHIALDQQLEIKAAAGGDTVILGVTATPERLDGRPLLGMYDVAVMGEQMQYFVANEFLKRPKLLSIPPKNRITYGADLKYGPMGDLSRNSIKHINELYKARAAGKKVIFGNEIDHYLEYSNGQSFLIFQRSRAMAEETAAAFRDAGIATERIDGSMTDKKRIYLRESFENRETMGLVTVDLLTYGFDAPGASCMIDMAECWSVAKQFQKLGRILRWDGVNKFGTIHDHVGNFGDPADGGRFGHPLLPRTWNFEGREKKEKVPKDAIMKVEAAKKCKICFGRIVNGICEFCGAEDQTTSLKPMKQIDGYLVEIKEPTPLKERPPENQRHYQSLIAVNKDRIRFAWYGDGDKNKGGVIDDEAVKNLVEAYVELKRQPMAIYYLVRQDGDKTVNVSLLFSIQKAAGYKNGWAYFKRRELEGRI